MQLNEDSIEDYRTELKRALEASQSRLARAVDRHIRQDNKPINIEDLASFPLGVWKDLSKNISAKKRANRFGSLLSFKNSLTEMISCANVICIPRKQTNTININFFITIYFYLINKVQVKGVFRLPIIPF